jgi:hypothetical protein
MRLAKRRRRRMKRKIRARRGREFIEFFAPGFLVHCNMYVLGF